MNINNLSDEELSRWIAEKLEPLDLSVIHKKCSPTCAADHDAQPDVSPLRYWWLRTRPEWHWQPRDMVNDPPMTVMLLDSMPCPTLMRAADRWICDSDSRSGKTEARNIQIGRAVAESWALWKGWKAD